MRFLPIIIFSLFSTALFSQDEPLGKEELKKFRDYEGSQINFEYDELISNYIYTSDLEKPKWYNRPQFLFSLG